MQKFPLPQLNEVPFYSSRRLLVYQREYLVLEKDFADFEGLQDWLTTNTLLSHQDIDVLCARGQIICGEGIYEEFFCGSPPKQLLILPIDRNSLPVR